MWFDNLIIGGIKVFTKCNIRFPSADTRISATRLSTNRICFSQKASGK